MLNDFDSFIEQFFANLTDDSFYQSASLTKYLSLPTAQRTNDEANIVDDKITRKLIAALGYSSGEIQYNLPQANKKRTDFTVRIAEYPRPCFVAESKNTATKKLSENLPQLADYMRSQGATRGLLIDGKTILTYEQSGGQIVLTGEIFLHELIKKWRGEILFSENKSGIETFDKHDLTMLKAFWQRFNKSVFEGLPKLIRDLTLKTNGEPHDADGKTWRDESRIKIYQQSEPEFNDELTKLSAEIIAMIALDVEAQLSLRLDEYEQFEIEENIYTSETDTFEQRFENLWAQIFSKAQAWQIPESRRNSYNSRLEYSFRLSYNGEVLDEVKRDIANDITEQNKSFSDKFKKKDAELKKAIKEVNEIVDNIGRLRQIFHKKRARLSAQYRQSIETYQAYKKWKDKVATILLKTGDKRKLQREFATQTAYVLFVRMLLVRILEDKDLINRIFTNGGMALWFNQIEEQYLKHAEGRSTDFLLPIAYESAQHIYAHYYSDAFVFDWYKADRNLIVRLLHRLAGFDFADIDRDIIGHIYSGYVRSEHKHESGMYYTPIEVVEYILNRVGYSGAEVLGQNLLDPSCGSGAFLVSACRRQIEVQLNYYKTHYKKLKKDLSVEEIRQILKSVKDSIFGLELNPFACYLAETNLLIQVLDLIKLAREKGGDVTLDRFNIFNTDTLRYEPETRDRLQGMPFPADELEPAEQIKGGLAKFEEGFDFVIGNPPYVKADEGAEGLLAYRDEIKKDHPLDSVRNCLVMRWDLMIPFVALGVYLLRNETGRLGMITSSAIEQVNYAAQLRNYLIENCQIDEVSFFPKVKLFEDAAVENTVFFVTKTEPTETSETLRLWHENKVGNVFKEERLLQTTFGERVFRQTISTQLYKDTTELKSICYISFAMRLNSADDAELKFEKDDLLSVVQDETHQVTYIEGENITPYELTGVKFLEYGEGLRAPSGIYRQTFPELYNRRKIMRGETSSAWLDNGTAIENGWMFCNHSVILFALWNELRGVENRSIQGELRNQSAIRKDLERVSEAFSLEYILAVMNSTKAAEILVGTTVSARRSRFQPDDFRKLPIPNATTAEQSVITEKVTRLLELGEEFLALRRDGWQIKTTDSRVNAPAVLSKYPSIRKNPLALAKVAWQMAIIEPTAFPFELRRKENIFLRGKNQKAVEFPPETDEAALVWIEKQFKQFPPDMSFQAAEAENAPFPATPAEALKALKLLGEEEQLISDKTVEFNQIKTDVDDFVENLYEERKLLTEN